MRKRFLSVLALLSLSAAVWTSCDTADIKVGVENGRAYFNDSTIVPKMILQGEEEKEIEDKAFFGCLTEAIQDQPALSEPSDYQPVYTVAIKDYRFALHDCGIAVTQYAGGSCEYWKHRIYVVEVECDEETMNELFSLLEEVEEKE